MNLNRLFFLICCMGFASFGSPLVSQDKTKKEEKTFFTSANGKMTLPPLLGVISKSGPPKYRNKIILYDPNIEKTATLKVDMGTTEFVNEKDKDDQYKEFHIAESLLALNGFTIVPMGNFLLVLKTGEAPSMSIDVLPDGDFEIDENVIKESMAVKVINTINVPPSDVIRALNPFLGKDRKATQFVQLPSNNGVLLLAPRSKIKFLLEIIKLLDVPGVKSKIEILKVEHTLPKDLTGMIKQLRDKRSNSKSKTPEPILIPDDRTLQIIVKATDEQLDEIKSLIALLDKPTENGEAGLKKEIIFHKLKNAKAEEVAATLNNLYQRIRTQNTKKNKGKAVIQRRAGTAVDDTPTIVAEKNINALLIIGATNDQYTYLQEIIERLDKRRDQVMIVSSIVEMSETTAWNLAIDLAAIDAGKVNTAGEVNPFVASSLGASVTSIDGATPGRTPAGVGGSPLLMGVTYGSIDALPFILNASASDSDVRSIAQPSIMANDNQQANIALERSVPYETTTTTDQSTSTNVEFAKAPINLTIKPTINAPDRFDAEQYVILDVNVNVSTFDFSRLSAGGTPGQSSRQAQTVVTVPDRGVVVIGGLTSMNQDKGETKVPLLGDIPLLGNLFKSQNKQSNTINIYIFISPIIMTNFEAAEEYANQKGIVFEGDKSFYSELKKRIWNDTHLIGTGLTDSDFYPKKMFNYNTDNE